MRNFLLALWRTLEIAMILSTYLVFHGINSHKGKCLGRRIREACERLGPTAIKFAQVLSLRQELFSEEDLTELQKLLDAAPPIPLETIIQTVEQQLGAPIGELFDDFQSIPMASGSIGQVHAARVKKTKERAVVKVRRPDIEKMVRRDMAIVLCLVCLAQFFSKTLRRLNAKRIIKQATDWLLEEIDFGNEVKNLQLMRESYKLGVHSPRVITPKPYPELSSSDVLVMEFIDGIPLNRWDEMSEEGLARGCDPNRSIHTFLTRMFAPIFQNQSIPFHADPHPANIFVLPDGDVGLVDLGLIGTVNPHFLRPFNDLIMAVSLLDEERATEGMLAVCGSDMEPTLALRKDIQRYVRRAEHEGFAYWFSEMSRMAVRHHISVPAEFSMIGKFVLVSDGLVEKFFPGYEMQDILGDALRAAMIARGLQNLKRLSLARLIYAASEAATKAERECIRAFVFPPRGVI